MPPVGAEDPRAPPRTWGGYDVVKPLGKGTFAVAYLCRNKDDNSPVVLKRFKVPLSQLEPHDRQEAEKEVDVLRELMHPNVVRYMSHFVESEVLHIVMEFASAGTLDAEIKKLRKAKHATTDHAASATIRFSEERVWEWFVQMLMALRFVHGRGYLHRDIKSANIMLSGPEGRVIKLGDFGLARQMEEDALATSMVGTPYYLSPELTDGRGYDDRSDVWALGCVLFELLALRKPFEARNVAELIDKIQNSERNQVPEDVNPLLRQLVTQMLTPEPVDRPTVDDLYRRPEVQEHVRRWESRRAELEALAAKQAAEAVAAASSSGAVGMGSGTVGDASGTAFAEATPETPASGYNQLDGRDARLQAWRILTNARCWMWGPGRVKRQTEQLMTSDVARVVLGGAHGFARTSTGHVLAWGNGEKGQLGLGRAVTAQRAPRLVEALSRKHILVSSVSAGASHSAAVSDGEILVWGTLYGKRHLALVDVTTVPDPEGVEAPGSDVAAAAAGAGVATGSAAGGGVDTMAASWGGHLGATARRHNSGARASGDGGGGGGSGGGNTGAAEAASGSAGAGAAAGDVDPDDDDDDAPSRVFVPCFVTTLEVPIAVSVSCGDNFTLALMSNGHVFSWGSGDVGRLGHGSTDDVFVPTLIETYVLADGSQMPAEKVSVSQVAAGTDHALAVSALGVFSWGLAEHGRLGQGTAAGDAGFIATPTCIAALAGDTITFASAGHLHSAFVSEDGRLWACGSNEHAQLGVGKSAKKLEAAWDPMQVVGIHDQKVLSVACGESHTVARVEKDGALFAWGLNDGRLGLGSEVDDEVTAFSRPMSVPGLRDALGVDCGRWSTLTDTAIVAKPAYSAGRNP